MTESKGAQLSHEDRCAIARMVSDDLHQYHWRLEHEEKFWYLLWSTLAAIFAVVVVSMLSYTAHKNIVMERMVEAGASPIEVACALKGEDRSARCLTFLGVSK